MAKVATIHPGIRIGPLRRLLGRLFLRLVDWKLQAEVPADTPKGILIGAPHTSNWDGVFLLALCWALGVRMSYLVSHTAFRWPFKALLRHAGGIPIDRTRRHGAVAQIARQLREAEAMYLTIAPAGSRYRSDYWKSGFYRIAREADVPLVCGFLDYRRKLAGIGPVFRLSGDLPADMDNIRRFYEGVQGKYPERMSRRRLRAEGPDPAK